MKMNFARVMGQLALRFADREALVNIEVYGATECLTTAAMLSKADHLSVAGFAVKASSAHARRAAGSGRSP